MTHIHKHVPLKLERKYLNRLRRHAIFMMTQVPDEHFEMRHFFDMAYNNEYSFQKEERLAGMATMKSRTSCGTSACSAGWAPVSLKIRNVHGNNHWMNYISEVFGLDYGDPAHNQADDYFFSGGWSSYDNTPEGAGARILYVLEKGIPVDEDDIFSYSCPAYRVGEDQGSDILPWIKEIAKQG